MSASGISVIIPALNEQESIGRVVASMPWHLIDECIVVDNGSTDGTDHAALEAGARVVYAERGYGSACQAGADAARESSDILVFVDGDGSDVIEALPRLTKPIEIGRYDFVIGSRTRGRAELGSMMGTQIFAAHLVGFLVWILHGVRYTDMGPFRAIRRSSLKLLGMSEKTYGWNIEMQVRAAQQKLKISEIPVDYRRRIGGVSKVSGNWKASIKTALRIFAVIYRTAARHAPRAG